jgi:hypothetical protein
MTTTDLYRVIPYDPAVHEDPVVFMWLRSFCDSRYGESRRSLMSLALGPSKKAYKDEFCDELRPVVMALLANSDTRVVVDVVKPSWVLGWSCDSATGGLHHYLSIKRDLAKVGEAEEIFRLLIGDRVHQRVTCTMEPRELYKLRLLPEKWTVNLGHFNQVRAA